MWVKCLELLTNHFFKHLRVCITLGNTACFSNFESEIMDLNGSAVTTCGINGVIQNKVKKLKNVYFLFAIFILHSRESDVSLCFGR